jgi:hypothetical protein
LTYFDENGISANTTSTSKERHHVLSDYFLKGDYSQLIQEAEEFLYYQDSKLIQFMTHLQHSSFYKWIRNL